MLCNLLGINQDEQLLVRSVPFFGEPGPANRIRVPHARQHPTTRLLWPFGTQKMQEIFRQLQKRCRCRQGGQQRQLATEFLSLKFAERTLSNG